MVVWCQKTMEVVIHFNQFCLQAIAGTQCSPGGICCSRKTEICISKATPYCHSWMMLMLRQSRGLYITSHWSWNLTLDVWIWLRVWHTCHTLGFSFNPPSLYCPKCHSHGSWFKCSVRTNSAPLLNRNRTHSVTDLVAINNLFNVWWLSCIAAFSDSIKWGKVWLIWFDYIVKYWRNSFSRHNKRRSLALVKGATLRFRVWLIFIHQIKPFVYMRKQLLQLHFNTLTLRLWSLYCS